MAGIEPHEQYRLYQGDCLDILPTLEAGSVDAIITDIPYGMTACKWDSIIPLDDLWRIVKHALKPRGVFVTTSSQPFTSALVMSNPEWFKYEWIWKKNVGSNFLNCKREPMKEHESVLVFCGGVTTYNAQRIERKDKERAKYPYKGKKQRDGEAYGNYDFPRRIENDLYTRVPSTLIKFNREVGLHPTQKPVALYEYLVRTYTNEGETVLDITMGSGTTGVACAKTGRRFIGIEIDQDYYAIAEKRIAEAYAQLRMEWQS